MKILLVEDDVNLREVVQRSLEKERYIVEVAPDFRTGIQKIEDYTYDCILLDIMLPDGNGLELLEQLKEMRKRENVIIISAKDSLEDKVLGLELGADDYLPKPFSPDELLARLRALTRRNGDFINENILEFSDIKLNLSTYDMEVNDNSITLTQKEFEILKYFMQRPKLVVSKDDLITKLWGFDSDIEHNNIEVYISFLRKKLAYVESNVKITTIRRVGYRLE